MNSAAFAVLTLIALAVAAISMTITKSRAFKGFRGWIKDRIKILHGLFGCPYCMSHWIALAGIWIYKPWVISTGYFAIDLIMHTFATVALAAPICGLIYVSFRRMLEDVEPEDDPVIEIDNKSEKIIEDEEVKVIEEEEEEEPKVIEEEEEEPEDDDEVLRKMNRRGKSLGTGPDLTAEKEKVVTGKPKKFVKKGKKKEEPAKPEEKPAPAAVATPPEGS